MSSFPCAGAPGDLEQRFRLIPAADATTAPSCRGTRRQQRARCIDAIRGMFAMCMPGSIASLGGCGGRPKAQYTLKFPHGIPSRTNNGILKFGAYNGHHTDEKGYFYYLAADGQSDSLRAKKPKKTVDQSSEQSGRTGTAAPSESAPRFGKFSTYDCAAPPRILLAAHKPFYLGFSPVSFPSAPPCR